MRRKAHEQTYEVALLVVGAVLTAIRFGPVIAVAWLGGCVLLHAAAEIVHRRRTSTPPADPMNRKGP